MGTDVAANQDAMEVVTRVDTLRGAWPRACRSRYVEPVTADKDEEARSPGGVVAIGPILGGVAAFLAVLLSQATTLVGSAILVGLGSILGWGLQALLTHKRRSLPAMLSVLSLVAGICTLLLLPAGEPQSRPPLSGSSPGGTTTGPSPDASSPAAVPSTPLSIPQRTMSFSLASPARTPDDTDGLIGIAKTTYGDPERLAISHMFYSDASDSVSTPSVVEAFEGKTAISLPDAEWQWFAAGKSGDRETSPVTTGDVHCTFHDQGDGTSSAECWRWDDQLALVVVGIRTPSSATRYLAPGIEDMFQQVESANKL
jgi:hypothetical protein